MTELLDQALKVVTALAPESQDAIARAMMSLAAADPELEQIDAADLPAVLEGLGQAERREFVSDDELATLFRRFGK